MHLLVEIHGSGVSQNGATIMKAQQHPPLHHGIDFPYRSNMPSSPPSFDNIPSKQRHLVLSFLSIFFFFFVEGGGFPHEAHFLEKSNARGTTYFTTKTLQTEVVIYVAITTLASSNN
jgi:hypothetical protein